MGFEVTLKFEPEKAVKKIKEVVTTAGELLEMVVSDPPVKVELKKGKPEGE